MENSVSEGTTEEICWVVLPCLCLCIVIVVVVVVVVLYLYCIVVVVVLYSCCRCIVMYCIVQKYLDCSKVFGLYCSKAVGLLLH